jgi:hypothetical protein
MHLLVVVLSVLLSFRSRSASCSTFVNRLRRSVPLAVLESRCCLGSCVVSWSRSRSAVAMGLLHGNCMSLLARGTWHVQLLVRCATHWAFRTHTLPLFHVASVCCFRSCGLHVNVVRRHFAFARRFRVLASARCICVLPFASSRLRFAFSRLFLRYACRMSRLSLLVRAWRRRSTLACRSCVAHLRVALKLPVHVSLVQARAVLLRCS